MTDESSAEAGRSRRGSRRRLRNAEKLVLDAAFRLLQERPFRELTVGRVMREAEVSRTAFYRHFDGFSDHTPPLAQRCHVYAAEV